jgi:hypothetical protein
VSPRTFIKRLLRMEPALYHASKHYANFITGTRA